MTCPRCGSAKTTRQVLSRWLHRWLCAECTHTWAEQVGPYPKDDPERKGER